LRKRKSNYAISITRESWSQKLYSKPTPDKSRSSLEVEPQETIVGFSPLSSRYAPDLNRQTGRLRDKSGLKATCSFEGRKMKTRENERKARSGLTMRHSQASKFRELYSDKISGSA